MRFLLSSILIFIVVSSAFGQVPVKTRKDTVFQTVVINGDTMPLINLKEIPIIPRHKFKNRFEERQYWRLVYNLKRVLPYSKIVASTVNQVESKLESFKTDKERRKFIKNLEDSLWNRYEKDMREMTVTQGKLLFKLVDRETRNTPYYWIDSYRGSVSAFFWQGMARLFGSNLKSEYNPEGDDKLIEEIVTCIEKGYI
ncbi:MAG: DUF4294 domain-containing protein [Bacteroidota bacterium]